MPGAKKTRGLADLTDGQRADLLDWLLAGLPFSRARALLLKQCRARATLEELETFWQQQVAPLLLGRRARAAQLARELTRVPDGEKPPFAAGVAEALQQQAFELLCDPQADLDRLKAVLSLFLKSQAADLARQKLEFERRKYRDALEQARDQLSRGAGPRGELGDAERQAILDKLDEVLGWPARSGTAAPATTGPA